MRACKQGISGTRLRTYRSKQPAILCVMAAMTALIVFVPISARAWWVAPGPRVVLGIPPIVLAPRAVYVPPPVVFAPPVYVAPPRPPVWIRGHWNGAYWVPAHWG
jgi:hypothetical protein